MNYVDTLAWYLCKKIQRRITKMHLLNKKELNINIEKIWSAALKKNKNLDILSFDLFE